MTHTLTLLERRAIRIVEEMAGQARIVSAPDHEGYVKIEIEIRYSTDILFLFHAGMTCGMDLMKESRAQLMTA